MAPNRNLTALQAAGVSIWLDTLSRQLIRSGGFEALIRDYRVTGATSNPTIFAKAITGSDLYDEQLRRLASAGERDPKELFFALALEDVSEAAALLRAEHDRSEGRDGYISFECTPDLADDTDATIVQAAELWHRLGQGNVMIKVPGTEAGLPAIEELTRRGVKVNITLLFSVERYAQVVEAYIRGLEARVQAGEPVHKVNSVASFFVSRIDTKVDARLAEASPLRGTVAVANARLAYQQYIESRRREVEPIGGPRRQSSTTAVGEHRDEGSRSLGRSLRLAADRTRRRQHHAGAYATSIRRPRPGGPDGRRRCGRSGEDSCGRRGRRHRPRRRDG